MRFKTHHAMVLLILVIAGIVAVLVMARQYWSLAPVTPVSQDQVSVPDGQQMIKQSWISFLAPKQTSDSGFELTMNVLQPLNTIEVDWSHPDSGEDDKYVLAKYKPDAGQARYEVRSDLGNFLPGKNIYTIRAVHPSPGIADQTFQLSFTVQWDLEGFSDLHPELLSFSGVSDKTDALQLELDGKLSAPATSVQVTSFHPKRGQASFRLLNKFHSGDQQFQYFAKGAYGNFFSGDNIYVVEALDAQKNILSRKRVTVQSTAQTVSDQVEGWFGAFKPLQDGWFVSSKLPWFSIRPVYDKLLFQQTRTDSNVLLPRPSLMYTAQASKDTLICDYLKGLDYHATGVSYVGNSYETCQQYNFGVSVFERFITPLTYKPFDVVRRIDYKGLTDKVSSAFLMIENGGMSQRDQKILSFEQMAEISDKAQKDLTDAQKAPPVIDVKPVPRYYVYQFLITESTPFDQGQILPGIASEIPEERKQLVEDLRAFLNKHSGDEIFTPLLFPSSDIKDVSHQDSTKVGTEVPKE